MCRPRCRTVQAEAAPGPLRGRRLQLSQRARASLGQERHRHDRALHVAEHEGPFLRAAQQRVALEARVHQHATKLGVDLEDALRYILPARGVEPLRGLQVLVEEVRHLLGEVHAIVRQEVLQLVVRRRPRVP